MPLDIQSGQLAERIRRVLGIRGRMPLRLDETVVPIVQAAKLDEPPYRQIESKFYAYSDQPASLGNFAFGGVALPSGTPGALVLDGAVLVNTIAADSYVFELGSEAGYRAYAAVAPPQLHILTEQYPSPPGAGVMPYHLPGSGVGLRGVNAVLGGGTGRRLGVVRLLNDTSIWVPLGVTLRPGWALTFWRATTNQPLNVSITGTYYPDGPEK